MLPRVHDFTLTLCNHSAVDLIERFSKHVEYSLKRDEMAKRALDLFAQGKDDAALEAAEEAELWALRAKALEP